MMFGKNKKCVDCEWCYTRFDQLKCGRPHPRLGVEIDRFCQIERMCAFLYFDGRCGMLGKHFKRKEDVKL
jgi:hypothetical protein